ncbi:MAG: ribonuclease Z [Bacteroidetes bacterium]|nr:ribonuclease Z [Bacteroidota bacterium]
MVPFSVTVLGAGSATPTLERYPASQVVNFNEQIFLVDCGEGTQINLRKYHIRFQRINHIFISHLHGDHFYGLPGLISTMDLLGRKNPLHIYCPGHLEEIIDIMFNRSQVVLDFPLQFHPLGFFGSDKVGSLPTEQAGASGGKETLYENDRIFIESFPLKHRIECWGFIFSEKPPLHNIRKEVIEQYSLSFKDIATIKKGSDLQTADGTTVPNRELTLPAHSPRRYIYCTDTVYDESLIPFLRKSDLLYHDSTFANDKSSRARETFHSTAEEAGYIAKHAEVRKLLLGHFSSRYNDLSILLQEARQVFPETDIAEEGKTYPVGF